MKRIVVISMLLVAPPVTALIAPSIAVAGGSSQEDKFHLKVPYFWINGFPFPTLPFVL